MQIKALEITDLRALSHVFLEPGPGINIIHGANGAGKTSLLEAIYLAGRGRTFRHSEARPVIRKGAEESLVVIKLGMSSSVGDSRLSTLGISRKARDMRCRLNGVDIHKRSQLAEALPVQLIASQPQSLLEMGPDIRRRFLDMAVFHVEHGYLERLSEFQRALRQRNAAIRSGSPNAVRAWDETYSKSAEIIDRFRRKTLDDLMQRLTTVLESWNLGFELDWRYRSGWAADRPLLSEIAGQTTGDIARGFTSRGPHRAEWLVTVAGQGSAEARQMPVEKSLSRGQLKMLVLALNLALIDLMGAAESAIHPVLLIDDLAAELDYANREKVMTAVAERSCQAFMTRLTDDRLPEPPGIPVFHVEQGRLVT